MMFEQQYTRHSRISENLKKIQIQQKYTFDTLYDDSGVGFINQSSIFKLAQKFFKIKGILLMAIILMLFIVAYSMATPFQSHIFLIVYATLQTIYEIQRQKNTQKQLLIFWLIFSTDILFENYFSRSKFTLMRYVKLIVVHICFMYRLKLLTFVLQIFNRLINEKGSISVPTTRKSYFK